MLKLILKKHSSSEIFSGDIPPIQHTLKSNVVPFSTKDFKLLFYLYLFSLVLSSDSACYV